MPEEKGNRRGGYSRTVEIPRDCGAGAWTRSVRQAAPQNRLVLEISERRADGLHLRVG